MQCCSIFTCIYCMTLCRVMNDTCEASKSIIYLEDRIAVLAIFNFDARITFQQIYVFKSDHV